MKDQDKTKGQLLKELGEVRSEMENLRADFSGVEQELKKAIGAANEERDKTRTVLEAMGEGISVQDTHYRILLQNQVQRDMVGDHVGEYCYRAYQGRDSVCPGCHLALAFSDGRIHKKEQSRITDEGVRYYEITAAPLKDSAGRIIAGIEAVRDITERKTYEQEREKLIGELREALEKIRTLTGLLPICAWCKKIRDDKGYWKKVEDYIEEHSDVIFTHGICPECLREQSPGAYKSLLDKGATEKK